MEQHLTLMSEHVTLIQALFIFSLFYGSNIPFVRAIIDVTGMPLGEEEMNVLLHATRDEQPYGGSIA
jgi:hypothetical protein